MTAPVRVLRTPVVAALLIALTLVLGLTPGVMIAPSPAGEVLGEVSGVFADGGPAGAAGAGGATGDVVAPAATPAKSFDPRLFTINDDDLANGIVRAPDQLRGYRWPLSQVRITQPFGPARGGSAIVDGKAFHDGIDLATFCGDHVLAAHDGVVLAAGRRYDDYLGWKGDLTAYFDRLDKLGLWGTLPIVVVVDDGNGYRSIYAHMYKLVVKVGDIIKAGALIGYEGATGHATGCHLHYGLFNPDATGVMGIDPAVWQKLLLPDSEVARIDPQLVFPKAP